MSQIYNINNGSSFQDLNNTTSTTIPTIYQAQNEQSTALFSGIDALQNTGYNYISENSQSYVTLMDNLRKLQQQQQQLNSNVTGSGYGTGSNSSNLGIFNSILAQQSKKQGLLDGKLQDSGIYMSHINSVQIASIIFASTLLIGGIIWYNQPKE